MNQNNINTQCSLISIRQNYNFDTLAIIWHEIVCWFLKIFQDLKRFAAQEHIIVLILTFRHAKQFYVPNSQKRVKNHKSTDKHSSFDDLIQEYFVSCIWKLAFVYSTRWKEKSDMLLLLFRKHLFKIWR